MKKMLILMLSLALLLSACGTAAQSAELPQESSSQIEQSSTAKSSGAEESSEYTLDEETEIRFLMDKILGCHPGTAGSSLKICSAAAAFLNYTESFGNGDHTLFKDTVEAIVAEEDDMSLKALALSAEEIRYMAESLIRDGLESHAAELEYAGAKCLFDAYNGEKFAAVWAVYEEIISGI